MDKLNHPLCINLDKALSITEIYSEFNDDELENVKKLLEKIHKICKCDAIAYIQKEKKLYTKDYIIAPLEKTRDILCKNDNYTEILNYAQNINKSDIIHKNNMLNKVFECDEGSFAVVVNISINNDKYIGCLVALYLKNTLGYKLFNEMDIHYYQLAANIIATQEKSFRMRQKLIKINTFRKNLNELSSLLYKTPNSKMLDYIDICLEITCSLWNIDRGYLFIVDYEQKKLIKTNEWCKPGVESLIDTENEIDITEFPWSHILYKMNKEISPIHIPNIDEKMDILAEKMDIDKNSEAYETFKKQMLYIKNVKKIKSVLLIPIIDNFKDNNITIGVLGFSHIFEYTYFKKDLIETLTVLSCYIAEAVKRYRPYRMSLEKSNYIFDKILEWQYENEENNKTFNILKDKMDKILSKCSSQQRIAYNV